MASNDYHSAKCRTIPSASAQLFRERMFGWQASDAGGRTLAATMIPERYRQIEPGFHVMIALRDTGTGLMNTRVRTCSNHSSPTKQRGKGSGLGLSAVYGIVRQSGGALDAANEPEGGAAVRIYLPWVVGAAHGDPLSTEMRASLRGTETVLLVEDDIQVRAITAEALIARA